MNRQMVTQLYIDEKLHCHSSGILPGSSPPVCYGGWYTLDSFRLGVELSPTLSVPTKLFWCNDNDSW